MKKTILSIFILCLISQTSMAGGQIPVSVFPFENKVGDSNCRNDWGYWRNNVGHGLREMLVSALGDDSNLEILEREVIKDVYTDEHQLINSEKSVKPKKGQFKTAKYVLKGALTEYEYCASEDGGGVDIGGLIGVGSLKVGGAKNTIKAGIDVRIIDVETGKIVKTIHQETDSSDTKLSIGADIKGVNGGFGTKKNSPMTKAVRAAIALAAQDISDFLSK